VFDAIVRSAKRLFGALTAAATRVAGDSVHLAAFSSTDRDADEALERSYPLPVDGTPMGLAVRTRAIVAISDVLTDPQVRPPRRKIARARGYRSMLIAPMLSGGVAIGTIAITRAKPGPFSDREQTLLKTFADQAVIAIENVRLFNETKEALEQQTATGEILKVISSSPTDVQPVFEAIAQRAATLSQAKFSYVTTFDGEWIHLHATWGAGSEDHFAFYPIRPGSGAVSARVIRDRAAVQIPDVLADPDYAHKDAARTTGF